MKAVDERQRQQLELVRRQALELEALAANHEQVRLDLERRQADAVVALKRRHVRELVDLWQAQGRQLGRWAQSVSKAVSR